MKNKQSPKKQYKRNSILFTHFFRGALVVLFAVGGLHTGLSLLCSKMGISGYVQLVLILVYWFASAAIINIISRHIVKKAYDEPLMRLADAAKKVADGDFSIRVETIHSSPKKYNYLDLMILDFNKMAEELSSIETLKFDFFSNVSHEMKTPLAIIGNNAQYLADDDFDEARKKECIENIMYALNRMNSLITNMLKLNKLENNSLPPAPKEYDICEQLAECVFVYDEIIENKNITLTVDIEERAFIFADPELIYTIWMNLFSNAVKFTPEGGTITLKQRSGFDFIEVSVKDSGCGMSEHTRRHVFDKFYQGDTSHSSDGNGLGLSLVKKIVELSEGTIDVKSTPQKGSEFIVRLPRDSAKA